MLKFVTLIIRLTWLKLREERFRYNLSYFWWFADPLVNTAVLYIVMVPILGLRGEGTAIFLLVGLVVWRMLTATLQAACNSIRSAMGLSQRLYLHKSAFIIRDVLAEAFRFAIALVVLTVVLFALGTGVANPLLVPVLFFVIVIFCLASAPWLALTGAVLTDLGRLLSYVFRLLFFISGIFFALSKVPVEWQSVFLLNPFALLLHETRSVFLATDVTSLYRLSLLVGFSVAIGALGFFLVHRFDRKIVKYMV